MNVGRLAQDLGGRVEYTALAKGDSGVIEKMDNGDYPIRVNQNHSENRQRFTIAHELGHFVVASRQY